MTFDINRSFKVIPFIWGEWDGERFRAAGFVGTQLPYLWTRFWWLFTVYDFVRYMILAVLPSSYHPNLEFFLGDYANAISGKPYRLMILIGPLYNAWLLLVMFHFQKMMGSDARYRYWLRYFRIPAKRSPEEMRFAGCSPNMLAKFWKFSSSVQSLVTRVLFIQGFFLMTSFALSYLFMMQKYRYVFSPFVFWSTLIANFISLQAIGTFNLTATHVPVAYLYLNCKILKERINRTLLRLQRSTHPSTFNATKVNRYLLDLGAIFDEVQRSDFFWSRYLSMNYYFAIAICAICFLCGLYSTDVFMIICSASMFTSSYFGTLVICFFVCGKLHETIRSLYGPLTNLIAKKNLKLSTSIKIERLLEFINSEHAGFRCGSVFLIRTDVTMELFFSIVINTILLYQMIFFLFYVPT